MSPIIHSPLLDKAGEYISNLFIEKLPKDLLFHNFQHTLSVVRGVNEFILNLNISNQDGEVLLLAAWFHDSGHVLAYSGHEQYSKGFAKDFLQKEKYPTELLERVLGCIHATAMPQNPTNEWEKMLCDADMYHLSRSGYFFLQKMLRAEWEVVLKKVYTDEEWNESNLKFLKTHSYHTDYGQTVFKKRKEVNIRKFEWLVERS
ncbi:MAG: putative metal-dependent HD superfamily phosphohydrolase [Polaribacter sp.]|jgi:predicted metal-dependent HD superfamily phosphohydrolase